MGTGFHFCKTRGALEIRLHNSVNVPHSTERHTKILKRWQVLCVCILTQ